MQKRSTVNGWIILVPMGFGFNEKPVYVPFTQAMIAPAPMIYRTKADATRHKLRKDYKIVRATITTEWED